MKVLAYFFIIFFSINVFGSVKPSQVKAEQNKAELDVFLKSNDKKVMSISYQEASLSKTIMTALEYNRKLGLLNNREFLVNIDSNALEILREFIQKAYKNLNSPYKITYDIDKIFHREKSFESLLSKLDFLPLIEFLEIPILKEAIINSLCSKEVVLGFNNFCRNQKYEILSDLLKQEWAEKITKKYVEKFINLNEDLLVQNKTINRLWRLNKTPIIEDNSFYVLKSIIHDKECGIYKLDAQTTLDEKKEDEQSKLDKQSELKDYVISINPPSLVCISDKLLGSIAYDRRTINIYDLNSKTLKKQLVSNYNSNIHSAILTHDNSFFIIADSNNVMLINLENFEINSLRIPGNSGLALSPCQNFLAVTIDKIVKFFCIRDKSLIDKSNCFYLYGKDLLHDEPINMVSYSPDGQYLATAYGNCAKIWDVKTSCCKQTLISHEDKVNSAIFSPCSNFLITASDDETIKIWNSFTGSMLLNLENNNWVRSAQLTQDGNFLISEDWNMSNTKIWDLREFRNSISNLPNLSLEQAMKVLGD